MDQDKPRITTTQITCRIVVANDVDDVLVIVVYNVVDVRFHFHSQIRVIQTTTLGDNRVKNHTITT